jgi:hypothetical protein
MNHEGFMKEVIRELQTRSLMTYQLSKTQHKDFRKWFFRKARKHFKWNRWKCQKEWNQFCDAFNIENK